MSETEQPPETDNSVEGFEWYAPGEDSYVFLDTLKTLNLKNLKIIDLGCSTGVLSAAINSNNLVVSVDLNVKALEEAVREEAQARHSGEKPRSLFLVRSDLLKGLNQAMFDLCVFNPPYVPDSAWSVLGGERRGRVVIDRFIEEVSVKRLLLLVILANAPSEIKEALERKGYSVEVVARRELLGETIIIFDCTRSSAL